MSDLKNTTIGGKSITLKIVPARDARGIQTLLASIIAEPLAAVLGGQAQKADGAETTRGDQILSVMNAVSGLLPKLDDGDLDKLIDKCAPFILVDGQQFNENKHFNADTLFDMYEVLWYFLRETFEGFIAAARLRLMPAVTATMASKK